MEPSERRPIATPTAAASGAVEVPVQTRGPATRAPWRTLPLSALRLAGRIAAARPVTLSGGSDGAVRELLLGTPDAEASLEPRAAAGTLRGAPFLCELSDAAFARVNERARRLAIDAGDRLLERGDPAEALLVVRDGCLVPVIGAAPPKRLAPLEPGDVAGELALFADEPAPASLEAEQDTRVVVLDRALAHELIAQDAEALAALLRGLRARATLRLLGTSPLFSPLDAAERRSVAARLRFLEADPGARLVAAERPAEALFVLLVGAADARSTDRSAPLRLGPGDVFAESLLAGDEAAPASVIARSRCWLLALGRGELRALLAGRPHLAALAAELVDECHARTGGRPLIDRRLALF